MVRHTQGNVSSVSQSTTEGQHYRVWSGFWLLFRAGVPQGLLAAGFTPPPGPQPTVTGNKGANGDMNIRKGLTP